MGSGNTTMAPPANQVAAMAVTRLRLVEPSRATWPPGSRPRAWRTAARSSASLCSWAQGTQSLPPPTTKVTVPDVVAAASRRVTRVFTPL